MRTIAWILGAVSIIICAMSIYSTIALDTRSRRKEVAIRKVHGAMRRDIYRLFGRLYFILIVLALFIAIPGAILFNLMMDGIMQGSVDATLSPVEPTGNPEITFSAPPLSSSSSPLSWAGILGR